jgi:hypothetical protein
VHKAYCRYKTGSSGYQVRSGKPGPGQSVFFADSKFGGRDGSKKAADAFMTAARPHEPAKPPRVPLATNNTGVSGVQYVLIENPGGTISRLLKLYRTGARTSVSLERHGMHEAIDIAIQFRKLKGQDADEARKMLVRALRRHGVRA